MNRTGSQPFYRASGYEVANGVFFMVEPYTER